MIRSTRLIKGRTIESFWCGLQNGFGLVRFAKSWLNVDDEEIKGEFDLIQKWLEGSGEGTIEERIRSHYLRAAHKNIKLVPMENSNV